MNELEVNCVTKTKGASGRETVTQIGNHTHRWTLSQEIAIQRIQAKVEAYYTLDRKTRRRSIVAVVREPGRAPYLGTHVDGVWNDDLLALGECGARCMLIA